MGEGEEEEGNARHAKQPQTQLNQTINQSINQ